MLVQNFYVIQVEGENIGGYFSLTLKVWEFLFFIANIGLCDLVFVGA